jgi:hypothetical protein
MKKIALVILMLSTLSCALAKKSKQKKKQKATTSNIVSVGLHRTMCYGQCPDYIIDINKNGTATYTGNRFTLDTGIFQKNIGVEKAKGIIDMFVKYKVDTCKEMYDNPLPDLPGLNITINYKNTKKTIYSASFGPDFLREIAEVMDEAGLKKDDSWKKIGMPKLD